MDDARGVQIPAQHDSFLEPLASPFDRDGGFHRLLQTGFALDGRGGPMLEYSHFELRKDSQGLSLDLTSDSAGGPLARES